MTHPVRLLPVLLAFATPACDRPVCSCPEAEVAEAAGPLAWRWVESPARLLDCVQDYQGKYQLDAVRRPGDGGWHVRFLEKDQELHARDWPAHLAFRVEGDVLYFPEYERMVSGCALVAWDLKAGKQLWRVELRGLGPVAHSKYRNEVDLTVADGVVTVYGRESAGRYVERVDGKTGRALERKTFPAREG
jgi:hypothetical protein